VLVDGNDVLALYVAAKAAVERARRGDGPTLIESYTYRLGDHTTSDDASRYRKDEELKMWEDRDPLKRFRAYLEGKGLWTLADEEKAWVEAEKTVDEEVERALAHPEPSVEDLFRFTYDAMHPELAEQLESLKREQGEGG
jgi:pyruvate dehydrogenase E1 component alpha subunit